MQCRFCFELVCVVRGNVEGHLFFKSRNFYEFYKIFIEELSPSNYNLSSICESDGSLNIRSWDIELLGS